MSAITGIEWTDRTWNPVTGCDKVSPGCAHCYAEGVAERFWATQYPKIPIMDPKKPATSYGFNSVRPRQFTDVMTHEDRLLEPLSWRKPSKVFVNSMSDLFHEDVPDAFIDRVFAVMGLAHQHTFQVLTKRPERMRAYMERATASTREPGYQDWPKVLEAQMPWLTEQYGEARMQALCEIPDVSNEWPHPNVWLGVSCENQHFADERIPLLLQTPAAVRFISAEPLLGPVSLREMAGVDDYFVDALDTPDPTRKLDWVIVGGESGPGARPFRLEWARSIIQQCQAAGVPVFVKQLGAVVEMPASGNTIQIQRGKNNDPAFWPEDLRVRQFPEVSA